MCEIAAKRVAVGPTSSAADKGLLDFAAPVVQRGAAASWPATTTWSMEYMATNADAATLCHGDALFFDDKVAKRGEPIVWETDCRRTRVSLAAFCDWALTTEHSRPPHAWGYLSYQRVADVLGQAPTLTAMLHWDSLGIAPALAVDAVLWVGTAGSRTPGHYDSYGTNTVVQLCGHKRWLLFPPGAPLAPTRVPFEESTVFSGLSATEARQCAPAFAHEVTLGPGDVLHVPHGWWHFVESLTPSVAVNVWRPHHADVTARVREALVRVIVSTVVAAAADESRVPPSDDRPDSPALVNPGEQIASHAENLAYLNMARAHAREELCAATIAGTAEAAVDHSLSNTAHAITDQCETTSPLMTADILRALTHPDTVATMGRLLKLF